MPISKYNKDGTVDIFNAKTGEVRSGVKPEELSTISPSLVGEYQIGQSPEATLKRAKAEQELAKMDSEVSATPETKAQKGLAGDLKQFWDSYQSVEGGAKGASGFTEAQLPKILGFNVNKGIGAKLFPKASAFDAQRDSLAFSMASAIAGQTGGRLSDKDVEVFKNSLPSRGDSPESAQLKIDDAVKKLSRRMIDSGATEEQVQEAIQGIGGGKTEQETTLGSILKAGGKDIGEIATDTKDLLKTSAQGYGMLPDLLQGVKRGDVSGEKVFQELGKAGLNLGGEVVKGTVNEYKDIASDPVKQFSENPVDTLLALIPVLQGAKKLKGVSAASKASKGLEAVSAVDKAVPDELANVIKPEAISSVVDTAKNMDPQIKSILDKASKAGNTEGVSQMSRNIYQSVLNFSKKDRSFERFQPNKTVGSMIEYGVSGTPDEILTKTKTVTGQNGILSNVVNEALVDANVSANLDDMGKVQEAIQAARNSSKYVKLSDKDFNTVAGELNNLPQIAGKGVGEYDLSNLLDYQRMLQKQAQPYRIAGRTDVAAQQMGEFLTDVADELGGIIDDKVKTVGSINKYKDPNIIAKLNAVSPKLAKEFEGAKTLSDIRSLQSPFVRMGQIMDLVLQEPSSLGKNLFRGAAQIPVVGPILDTVAQSVAVPVATKTAVAMNRGTQNPVLQSPAIQRLLKMGQMGR